LPFKELALPDLELDKTGGTEARKRCRRFAERESRQPWRQERLVRLVRTIFNLQASSAVDLLYFQRHEKMRLTIGCSRPISASSKMD
jgi:hypothetical protein